MMNTRMRMTKRPARRSNPLFVIVRSVTALGAWSAFRNFGGEVA
jgi:hypothetical protein